MAKKRVHEIAKEKGISSKEVIAKLQAAGLDVKAAASSVDENDIAMAFGNGKVAKETPQDDAEPKRARPARPVADPASQSAKPKPADAAADAPKPPADGEKPAAKPDEAGGEGGQRQRPVRRPGQAPAGGRRRVVIDSAAGRRERTPPPQQQQPPRRGRGRRRRTPWVDLEDQPQVPVVVEEEAPTQIQSGATVKEVAESLGLPAPEIIKKLMGLGEMATLTQTLSDDAIQVLADELEKKVQIVHADEEVEEEPAFEDSPDDLVGRPPVVTIMGHVDHGKTSLLDAIRETEVAAGEAGGITQHIGAYQVHHDGHTITFLDTPGHEAFTAMRARGASVTDIAVIVVAADDGVMPQTVEAIDHSKAAEVPIMIAVNKIDLEGADPNRVRGELAQQGLTPSDWGGDTEFRDVSAKTRDGLDGLLEDIITIAEIQELKANPNTEASGVVVESRLDPGRGPVVTVLVQRGTLKVSDALVAGAAWGRVRAMHDYRGEKVEGAKPGDPVEVLGFDGVPEAGERVRVVTNERVARSEAADRAHRLKTESLARRAGVKISLEDIFDRAQKGELKELNLVVKADVAGSLEAILDEIAKLPQEEVTVNVIRDGVGGIAESDVMLASASNAIMIGFNVRPVQQARHVAEREGVEIRTYSVIYRMVDELRKAMEGLLEPEEVEKSVATIEVREIFKASRVGTIAGCYITDGKARRGATCRLVRDGTIVYHGRIGTLRRFKDDVREVESGYECGVTLENYQDVKQGDVIEVYETEQVEREL
ncbi:MAG TPA: translation initiation factor IF-2 [Thermoleophilaceae bacterium]|nr:translation initiation factor IF-2 [Thermoleophilaceae bacterium]